MKFKYKLLMFAIFCTSCSQNTALTAPVTGEKITAVQSATEDTNTNVYKLANPSVVSISVTSQERVRNRFVTVKGEGSGIIISKTGYIVTNSHVVRNSTQLNILFSDNSTHEAKLISDNPENDIAIIKVDGNLDKITLLPFGNSDNLEVGEMVFAIGNPFGLPGTFTDGIVSSLNRDITSEDGTLMKNLIQTDAAINPGNSGGPLLDKNGNIIGINIAMFSTSGGNLGIGFAIPVNQVKEVIQKANIADLKI